MTHENTALVDTSQRVESAMNQVMVDEKVFELAQRKAQIYAKSSLVPKEYQNNIGNVLIAENMARRMGADTLMVMQNLYVVHGKPGWSATFLIASFNSNGRFSAIKYRFVGEANKPDWGCQAYCTETATGEEIEGTTITWEMALAEGWVNKAGSKWKTMPEQMFRYRAATFLIRSTAPEIGMGLLTKEELEDMPSNGRVVADSAPGIEGVKDRLKLVQETPDDEPEAIDVEDEPAADEPADHVDETIHDQPDDSDAALDSQTEESVLADLHTAIGDRAQEIGLDRYEEILNGRKTMSMDKKQLTAFLKELSK